MTNPLVYKPKIKKAPLVTGGVNTSPLGRRYGDEAMAKGVQDLAKATGALKAHLDGIDDTNEYSKMTSQLEIEMGKAIIGIEGDNDPDTYYEEVDKAYQDVSRGIGEQYKWKTPKFGLAWNGFIESSKAKYMKAADRKQADMRIDRALVGVQDARKLAGQSAAMQQDHKTSQLELEERLGVISDGSRKNHLETNEQTSAADNEVLRKNDWFYAVEQVEALPEQAQRFMKNEKAFFEQYKYLGPESLTRLRTMAKNKINQNRQKKADLKAEEIDKYDRGYIDLKKKFYDAENATDRAHTVEQLKDYVTQGAELKGATWVESHLADLYNPKVKANNKMYLDFMRRIDNGQATDASEWVEAGMNGALTPTMVKSLDQHLKLYKKNHGMVNQWTTPGGIYDMADRKFGKDRATPNYQRFLLTMKHIQREAVFGNSNPDLHRAASKLINTIDQTVDYSEGGIWEGKHELEDLLDMHEPWKSPGQRWEHHDQWDMRIPTADPKEISEVKRMINEANEKLRKAGKPVKRVTPALMQKTLSWMRENE
jgi:hypothetical protein